MVEKENTNKLFGRWALIQSSQLKRELRHTVEKRVRHQFCDLKKNLDFFFSAHTSGHMEAHGNREQLEPTFPSHRNYSHAFLWAKASWWSREALRLCPAVWNLSGGRSVHAAAKSKTDTTRKSRSPDCKPKSQDSEVKRRFFYVLTRGRDRLYNSGIGGSGCRGICGNPRRREKKCLKLKKKEKCHICREGTSLTDFWFALRAEGIKWPKWGLQIL